MASLSKKVQYPCDNFLLGTCQFMASSQHNGKFTEFVRLHEADSSLARQTTRLELTLYIPEITKILPDCTLFNLFAKVFFYQFIVLPIRQSFPLYSISILTFLLNFILPIDF